MMVITNFFKPCRSKSIDVHGLKKFVTSIMVVEPAEGTPPKRSRAKRKKKVPVVATPLVAVAVPAIASR